MSDNFLNQFNKNDATVEGQDSKSQTNSPSKNTSKSKIKALPGRDSGSVLENKYNQKIASTEHIVEKDESFHKRKMIRYGVIGGSVFAVCLVAIFIFRMMNQVEIKDFVGTSIAEAKTWGLTNGITIEVDEIFDLEYDEDKIINQNVEASSKLQKGAVLNLTVSKGPDQDEVIKLPEFKTMTPTEVNAWRQKNKVFNVNVREEYDEEIEKGKFIKMEFGSKEVTEKNYTRGDGLIIYMSKGVEEFEKNIEVPDFKNQPLMTVEEWAKKNDIELIIEEKASDKIMAESVISQSIKAGDKVAKQDEVTVVVSLGQSVKVPNFSGLTAEEATSEVPELNVLIQNRYSSTVAFGKLISQSEPAGKELLVEEMTKVNVVYSLGRPYIENLIGTSEGAIAALFHEFTSQGANISYGINYVDSYEEKGNIVGMSKYAQFLSMTDHVNIDVSKGNLTPPVEEIPVEDPPVEEPPVETPPENIPEEVPVEEIPEDLPIEE